MPRLLLKIKKMLIVRIIHAFRQQDKSKCPVPVWSLFPNEFRRRLLNDFPHFVCVDGSGGKVVREVESVIKPGQTGFMSAIFIES